ncbi:spore germination protein [Bacillus sp. FJAT-29953]|nr:spore germination protein [Bacillus sp. FJAT-29953]
MEVNVKPRDGLQLHAFLLIFIVHSTQIGVGLVGLPRIVYLDAGHDGWISVFLAGVLGGVSLWFMVKMLGQYDSADLYGIHADVFGKWIGNFLSLMYMGYLAAAFFVIYINYIEIVQVWIFPNLPTWQLGLVLILLSAYAVYGGIRVVVGTAFLSVMGTLWMVFVLFVPLKHSEINHIFPILDADIEQILKGAHNSSLSMMGMELVLFVYPYIKEKQKTQIFSQIGNAYTAFIFTLVTFVSIIYYAGGSLEQTIWPVISLFKIVRLPNLERFEIIAVSFWMLIIQPNLCIYLWAASKGFSRIFAGKQKWGLWILASLIFVSSFFVKARYQMNLISDIIGKFGFYAAVCYPILLYFIVSAKNKYFRGKNNHAKGS